MMTESFDDCLTLRTEKNSLKKGDLIKCLNNSTANSKLASAKKMDQLNGPVEISVHCHFIVTMGVSEFSTLNIYKFVV